jgi:hypothetical protein
MPELLIPGYLTAVVMAFVGAVLLPRMRWLLLVLGTLGVLLPVAAIIALLASLDSADVRFG